MKKLLMLSFLSTVGFANVRAQATADEAAVRTLVDNFANAFNAHDVKAFAATFAEDADFTNWGGRSTHGRSQIEAFHVKVLTGTYKNGSQQITDRKIRFIRPDVAVVDVWSEVTGAVTPDGKADSLRKFLLNWTVTKEVDGQWLIKIMHNTRLPETETSPGSQK